MADDLATLMRTWRHDLHARPEQGFAEHATSDYVAAVLTDLGLDVVRGVGGTGVVATLARGGTASVGLRADMDALALTERGEERPYRSRNDGSMHACGHDGHMAMLLGAAHRLLQRDDLEGTVRFVFQPAEEHGRGARAMVDDGLFTRFGMDAMFGLHNTPGLPAGHLATRSGPLMAAEDRFEIVVVGVGGHASGPHRLVDPLVVAAQVILALQTIVARSVPPLDVAVVSCTEIEGDGVRNAVPGRVVLRGDVRSFTPEVRALVERRMREICAGVAAAHGARCEVTWSHEFEPTVNDDAATALAVEVARRVVPEEHVDGATTPWTGSEDFGVFAGHVPACFVLVGNGTEPGAGGTPLHSADYDFNDDVLPVGSAFLAEVAVRALAAG